MADLDSSWFAVFQQLLPYGTIWLTCTAVVATMGGMGILSLWHIAVPTMWSFPWPTPPPPSSALLWVRQQQLSVSSKTTTVLMAGSFNPPHLGHVEMIQYLASWYGHVIVVVGHNPHKRYAVSPDQRVALLKKCLVSSTTTTTTNEDDDGKHELQPKLATGKISVRAVSGYIWQHVPEAEIFFRGIRTWEKDGAEERILQIQNTWGPIVYGPCWWPRTTIFLEGNPKFNHISSTLIRELCSDGQSTASSSISMEKKTRTTKDIDSLLAQLVPECIVSEVRQLYAKKHAE